jgi:single-stranded DNA-specific DHH superfamily exonuclease
MKNGLINKTIEPAMEFIKKIKSSDGVVIAHDDDADGVCSGAIIGKLLKKTAGVEANLLSTEWNISLSENIVKKILSLDAKYVIILDTVEIAQSLLDELTKCARILIIDHHTPDKYRGVVYCNPRVYDKNIYMPTTYICNKIYEAFTGSKELIWIGAMGVLGDHGVTKNLDLFEDLKKEFPELLGNNEIKDGVLFDNSKLGLLAKIIDGGRVVKENVGAEFVSKMLAGIESYQQLLLGSTKETKIVLDWYEKVKKEFDLLLKDFEKNKKQIGKRIIFYDFKSDLKLKSSLATALSDKISDKILVIGQRVGDRYDISMRRGEGMDVNLRELIKHAIENIPNSRGGGHPEAVGGKIPKEYLQTFLKNLE